MRAAITTRAMPTMSVVKPVKNGLVLVNIWPMIEDVLVQIRLLMVEIPAGDVGRAGGEPGHVRSRDHRHPTEPRRPRNRRRDSPSGRDAASSARPQPEQTTPPERPAPSPAAGRSPGLCLAWRRPPRSPSRPRRPSSASRDGRGDPRTSPLVCLRFRQIARSSPVSPPSADLWPIPAVARASTPSMRARTAGPSRQYHHDAAPGKGCAERPAGPARSPAGPALRPERCGRRG